MVKMRHEGQVDNRAVYVAIVIDLDGRKDVLGLWSSAHEGAKFWLQVLTELNNRGVKDVFIACVDGLKGFPEAIATVFPQAQVQLCIVHLVRASLNYVNWQERKAVAQDLRTIYHAATAEEGESLNMSLRKVLKPRAVFPSEEAARKVMYLALKRAKAKWQRPFHWKAALNRFTLLWEDRIRRAVGTLKVLMPSPG